MTEKRLGTDVMALAVLVWISIAAGCTVTATEPVSGPNKLLVCLQPDTAGYFHGDFDRDGVSDSIRIALHRCW